jgi:hypothetical protein
MCVWIEIPIPGGFNLLVDNHNFHPNTGLKAIENYITSSETKINTYNFRVALLGDFNVPD